MVAMATWSGGVAYQGNWFHGEVVDVTKSIFGICGFNQLYIFYSDSKFSIFVVAGL